MASPRLNGSDNNRRQRNHSNHSLPHACTVLRHASKCVRSRNVSSLKAHAKRQCHTVEHSFWGVVSQLGTGRNRRILDYFFH